MRYTPYIGKSFATVLIAMPMAIINLQAQQTGVTWNPGSSSPALWSNPANWGGTVPVNGYKAFFNIGSVGAALVDTAVGGCQLSLGDGGSGTVEIENGGSLSAGDTSLGNNDLYAWTAIGNGNGDNGVMTVDSGGSVTFNYHLWVGQNAGSHGTLNLDGGTATVTAAFGLGNNGGVGVANINSGVLNLLQANIIIPNANGSVLDIFGGTVVIPGDYTSTVNSLIAAGKIEAYGGAGTVLVDYNTINSGHTTLSAIPEPGTLALLGVGLTGLVGIVRARKNQAV